MMIVISFFFREKAEKSRRKKNPTKNSHQSPIKTRRIESEEGPLCWPDKKWRSILSSEKKRGKEKQNGPLGSIFNFDPFGFDLLIYLFPFGYGLFSFFAVFNGLEIRSDKFSRTFFLFSFFLFFLFFFLLLFSFFSFFFLSFYTHDPSPRPLILLPLSRPILFSLSLFLSFRSFSLSLFLDSFLRAFPRLTRRVFQENIKTEILGFTGW